MARELVNLSNLNEKLEQQTTNYPILNDKYKVRRQIFKNMILHLFTFNHYFIGFRKTI